MIEGVITNQTTEGLPSRGIVFRAINLAKQRALIPARSREFF